MADAPMWECDIISCRYNAIVENNVSPVPIFSPMDEIEIATGFELSDYMFVEIPIHKLQSIFMTYAYDGPRWYSKSECQFLLECAFAPGRISYFLFKQHLIDQLPI